jgi:hypothetical protein
MDRWRRYSSMMAAIHTSRVDVDSGVSAGRILLAHHMAVRETFAIAPDSFMDMTSAHPEEVRACGMLYAFFVLAGWARIGPGGGNHLSSPPGPITALANLLRR